MNVRCGRTIPCIHRYIYSPLDLFMQHWLRTVRVKSQKGSKKQNADSIHHTPKFSMNVWGLGDPMNRAVFLYINNLKRSRRFQRCYRDMVMGIATIGHLNTHKHNADAVSAWIVLANNSFPGYVILTLSTLAFSLWVSFMGATGIKCRLLVQHPQIVPPWLNGAKGWKAARRIEVSDTFGPLQGEKQQQSE